MITQLQNLESGVHDAVGEPLAYGTVTIYEAGTTDLQTGYQEFELENPHANPLTLDAAGRAEVFVDGRVKLVIHDADGNLVRTVDNLGIEDGQITAVTTSAVPTGTVFMWPAAAAPAGYLFLDGTAYSRSAYADLFAILGTTWGAGDGSTTFNVPDWRGRTVVGVGTGPGGLTARALAATFGSETHALSEAELASHTHGRGTLAATTASDGSHTHTIEKASSLGTGGAKSAQAASGNDNTQSTSTEGSHTHTITLSGTIASTGSGTAHNNMQPSVAANFIIKT